MSRFGARIVFSTGTDEHGMKIQQAAVNNKTSVDNYCADISHKYKNLSKTFNIQYTNFIQTSERKHKETVQYFWVSTFEYKCYYIFKVGT